MRKSPSLILFFLSILSLPAFADTNLNFRRGLPGLRGNEGSIQPQDVRISNMVYGGTGCPDGTMRMALAPDNLSFSILFDQFVVDSGHSPTAYAECTVKMAISMPPYVQMAITRIDIRGFANVPAGAFGMLQSRFQFSDPYASQIPMNNGRGGSVQPVGPSPFSTTLHYSFPGPSQQEYVVSSGAIGQNSPFGHTVYSPCGGSTSLEITNALIARAPQAQETTLTMDSIDAQGHATYFVSWQRCMPPQPSNPGCGRGGCQEPQPYVPGCGRGGCQGAPPSWGGGFR